jgi:hypothetical protein
MKKFVRIANPAAVILAVLMIGACGGSYQARQMDVKQSVLVNPSLLEKGGEGQALYRYINPKRNMEQYTKVMVDPVLIVKEAELDQDELDNYQKLANNGFLYLSRELQQDYDIVKSPGPNTLRIQMAILDADNSKPVRNLLSSVSPVGIVVNAATYTATGKQAGVGEISAEFKLADAKTGVLLGAAMDTRVGGKNPEGIVDPWYNADEALKYWAKRIRYILCTERSGKNCVKP